MLSGLCAKRVGAVGLLALPVALIVLLSGTPAAVAADRMVFAENATATW